ncbi:MAG TPA: SRPBCC family protein [Actinomycetota bacterium]|jgi:carbon monoxide dehydrogenase subunit G
MKIEQTVEVEAPLDRVWALVNDVPRVAPCMPGAELTKVVDERTYEGTVRVKLGPINLSYKGTVMLDQVDEAGHSAQLSANGRDVRGGGTAKAKVDTRLEAISDSRTRMSVVTDLHLTGRVASFGRGAVQDVSAKLFGEFAQCLRQTLEAAPSAAAPAAPAATQPSPAGAAAEPAARPPTLEDTPAPTAGGVPAPAAGEAPVAAGEPRPPAAAASGAAPAAAGRPLRAGGLVATVVVGRLRALVVAIGRLLRRLAGLLRRS